MTQARFVEWRIPFTVEQVQAKVAGATYVFNVDIHLDRPFKGAITVTCDGMMTKAVTSHFSSMAAFKGDSYTFRVDTTKEPNPTIPITVTVYANMEVHVKEVTLRE